MYLKTPKRYTAKGSRRRLFNLRWLWLYLLAPVIIIPAALAWQYREPISGWIGERVNNAELFKPPPPTATPAPTLPANPEEELANAYKAGRVGKAIEIMNSISESAPNEVIFRVLASETLALRSYGTNKAMLEGAINSAKDAINANPEAPDGWIAMAMALDWSERYSEALGYILRARDLAAGDPMLLAVTAEVYSDLKKYDQAAQMVDQAIESARSAKPVNRAALAHAYYVKARILEDRPEESSNEEIIDSYEQAWRVVTSEPVDPTIPAGYIAQNLGRYYFTLQQTDRAITTFSAGIDRDREDSVLLYWVSAVYYNKGDYNKSREYIDQCRDVNPNSLSCLSLLSKLLMRDQNYQQTAEVLEKAIDLGTKDPNDYLRAALAYISGQAACDKAIPILQKGATFISPDQTNVRTDFEDTIRSCGATLDVGAVNAGDQPAATDEAIATQEATAAP